MTTENTKQELTMLQEQMLTRIENTYNVLIGSKDVKNRIPENVFTYYFLPYFTGKVQSSEDQKYTATWIAVAGSPTAEVDVFGPDGKTLFTVPPIVDTSRYDPTSGGRGKSITAMVSEAELYGTLSPVARQNAMDSVLSGKLNQYIKDGVNQENALRWYEIFKRYGLVADEVVNTQTKENESRLDPDEFTFGDD